MIDIDKWQEIFSSLGRHKLRTFLTAFSVWWGIFMLIILLGAGNGLENSAKRDFKNDAANVLWIWSQQTSEPYKGLPAGRFINLDNEDFDIVSGHSEVTHSSIQNRLWGEFFISYKDKSLSYTVQAVYPGHKFIELPKLTEGRFINEVDIQELRKVCVIGEVVKKGFFGKDTPALGEYLNIKGVSYQIVGIFYEEREREMERIYVPTTTVQRIEGNNNVQVMAVDLGETSLADSKALEGKIRQELAAQHKFSPTDLSAIGIHNRAESFQEIQTVMTLISTFIWFVGIGSIIAGVIGVSNIMLIIVKERTREIGVRKALGATPLSIISMIVQESVFLTSLAGYIGLASGLGVVYGINRFMEANNIEAQFFYQPEVNVGTVLLALLVLVLSGVFAGLIPALQAVRINPVTAMKG